LRGYDAYRGARTERIAANGARQCELQNFSWEDPEAVRRTLEQVAADAKVSVTIVPVKDADGTVIRAVGVPPSPLLPEVVQAEEKTVHHFWPGLPVVPAMSTGATDGRYLRIAGIPTYGIACMFLS